MILNGSELSTLLLPSKLLQGITMNMKYKHLKLFTLHHRSTQSKLGFVLWCTVMRTSEKSVHIYSTLNELLFCVDQHTILAGVIRVSAHVSGQLLSGAYCNHNADGDDEGNCRFKCSFFFLLLRQNTLHIRLCN